ncbi:unnamed protein product [Symbiodinium natans]|uniref:Uncharacterized protein n=1 Tax=Symbiodinium natans TaxID=878477 RepID=A0A812PYZ2_9DINO|nr:unnamed protein product [Symbiodinium natans]
MASIRRRRLRCCACLVVATIQGHTLASGTSGFVTASFSSLRRGTLAGSPRWRCARTADIAGLSTVSTGDLALGLGLLSFIVAYLPQVLRVGQGSAWQVGGFRYFANRGRKAFSDATHELAAKYPGYSENSVFTYFDTFGGKVLPDMGSYSRLVRLIDRGATDVYDHKRGLELRLREFDCPNVFAATYFSASEALEATSSEPDAIFFAKLPEQSGGRGIRVLSREDLCQNELPSEYIVQRAVQDLELIDDRKFVIRYYFVVHQKRIYLHERGVLIVHGARYDRLSVDFDVQVRHDWFEESSETYLLLLQSAEQAWPLLQLDFPTVSGQLLESYMT